VGTRRGEEVEAETALDQETGADRCAWWSICVVKLYENKVRYVVRPQHLKIRIGWYYLHFIWKWKVKSSAVNFG